MIEVKTKLDINATKTFLRLQMRQALWALIVLPIIFILLGVLLLVSPKPDFILGITVIVVGALFPLAIIVLSRYAQKKMDKSAKLISDETLVYFKFEEDKFCQEAQKGEGFKEASESNYSILYKVIETKSHFFLFISKMQAYIIPKKDIVTGCVQDLQNILTAKVGSKYKTIKTK